MPDLDRAHDRACRSDRRWCRFWAIYVLTALFGGIVGDVVAYIRGGYPASLSAHIRRWLGMEPRSRYARAGQVGLLGFLTWAAMHLSFGVLGPDRDR